MAKSRGYQNYRGRTPKWKVALAVLLFLVILAAAITILMQKNIVYDETGTPHLDIPWKEKPSQEQEDLDLVIQENPAEREIRAAWIAEAPLTEAAWRGVQTASDANHNAVAVTMKDAGGTVYFDSAVAAAGSVKLAPDTVSALAQLTGDAPNLPHTIAVLSCFRDPKASNSDVEGMGLKNTGGYIFYDGNNDRWLDPGKPAARQYLCRMAEEIAKLGFDEILLTDVSYPTEGKLHKISYGDVDRPERLQTFLREMKAALEPYQITLSLRLEPEVISQGIQTDAGQELAKLAPEVDRIYAPATAEETPALAAAVKAASAKTAFVPITAAALPGGSYLLAPS